MNWGEVYFDRFVKLFGNPINQAVWEKEGFIAIQVLTFAPSPDLLTFCSIGLTLYPDKLGGTFEVFLPVGDRLRDAPNILGRALTTMIEKALPLKAGVSFSGIDKMFPDFSVATGKTALYFTRPVGLNGLDAVSLSDNGQGVILMGFFISTAETEFLEQNGAEKFEAALAEAGVDPADMSRKSIF